MRLNIANVEFGFDSRPILKKFHLALAPAEIVAVCGPNGVGKSTLIKYINRIEVMALIQSLVREKSISVIMAVHDLNLASRYADKIIMMKGGRIFGAGDVVIKTVLALSAADGGR